MNKYIYTSQSNFDYRKYNPKYSCSVTPSFYAKYFSIGCGFGGVILDEYESSTSTPTSITTYTGTKDFFQIRPEIGGFIQLIEPDATGLRLMLNVGYNFVPKLKDLNGFQFGIGIQIAVAD